jgi:hypothetical protein
MLRILVMPNLHTIQGYNLSIIRPMHIASVVHSPNEDNNSPTATSQFSYLILEMKRI